MPGQIRAVPGTNTIYGTRQAVLFNVDESTLWTLGYPSGNRGPITLRQGYTADGGWWPARRGMGFCSDPTTPASLVLTNDMGTCEAGSFSPWHNGLGGSPHVKFIMGVCYDSLSATVSGAIVQGFRTSDDLYVGETTSDSNGRYEFGTPYPSTDHYLVAYRAGSPDIAGTTVNTLQGTNRDGT